MDVFISLMQADKNERRSTETVFNVVRGMILAHTFPVVIAGKPISFNQDIKVVRGKNGLGQLFLAHWFSANAARFLRIALPRHVGA